MNARKKEALTGYLFAAPWLIGFCVFLLYPLLASLYYSFCDYSVLKPPVWIGSANYTGLFQDEVFRITLWNTAFYAVLSIAFGLCFTLSLALLLNSKVKGMTIYRTLFYVPSLVPSVSLAVLWLWVFNGQHGIVNELLKGPFKLMHLDLPNWLGDPNWAKPALILMSIWGAGNTVIIYLAGLQDIPVHLYEAAQLDGASWWEKTKNVTIPMLSPVIFFNFIMGIIGSIQVFTVPYIMFPGGSPSRSTYFLVMYLFDNAFIYHKMGYACAMGWIMFVIILSLTWLARTLSEKYVYYEGS